MDRHSDSTGVSPTPFSPFSSNNSMASEGGTSDEPADLGQMAAVFEAFRTEFAPRSLGHGQTQALQVPALGMARAVTPTSSLVVSPSDGSGSAEEGDVEIRIRNGGSWSTSVGAVMHSGGEPTSRIYSDSNSDDGDEDESSYEEEHAFGPSHSRTHARLLVQAPQQDAEQMDGIDQPSLGYLDDVLGFLAAERAKFTAQREAGLRGGLGMSSQASTSESAWRHVVEPRRRRRRKRPATSSAAVPGGPGPSGKLIARGMGSKSVSATSGTGSTGLTSVDGEHDLDGDNEGDADVDAEGIATPMGEANELDVDGSSSGEYWARGASRVRAGASIAKSMPSTPPKSNQRRLRTSALNGKGKGKERAAALQANVVISSSRLPLVSAETQPMLKEEPQQALPKLSHSRSTPSLRLAIPQSIPPDARVLQLRTLATKLRMFFTENAKTLSSVLLNDGPEEDGFIDPRGRPAREGDPLVHVFIDHSNILIGFLNYLRRFPPHTRRPKGQQKTYLCHAALSLILERGRPISRRVLATSSPLYQPMDSAERLGYEVKVYARVPDTGTGLDRERGNGRERERDKEKNGKRNSSVSRLNGTENISADSDPCPVGAHVPPASAGNVAGTSRSFVQGHTRSSSLNVLGGRAAVSARRNGHNNAPGNLAFPLAGTSPSSSDLPPPPRIRYREQGVDELLQLKLHQALSSPDPHPPPPNSTIVLATGDGNVGQFNEEGFLGCVRTALRKGWRVELYAWEGGLSRSWVKEFGGGGIDGEEGGEWGDKFKIVGLEKFANDLLVVY